MNWMTPIKNFVWLDVETNGTSANNNFLLEVACLITDTDLNIVDEVGYQAPVYYPKEFVDKMYKETNEYVQNMHTKTGLWDRLSEEGKALSIVNDELLAYIQKYNPEPQSAWIGGNSTYLDHSFMDRYLPKVAAHLHYRELNVTSWGGPIQLWLGKDYEKKSTHRAMDDIRESIEQMQYYKTLIKPW